MNTKLVTILTDEGLNTLRNTSSPVILPLSEDTMKLIQELKDFVKQQDGLGMAAIQLGVAKNLFVMRKPWKSDNIVAIINPRITHASTKPKAMPEACFSVPLTAGFYAVVSRPEAITVAYDTEFGTHISHEELSGFEARIFQHEIDHLVGVLMIDKNRLQGWSGA